MRTPNWLDAIAARGRPRDGVQLPDYAGGSILNLMRSLADACGGAPLPYPALRGFDTARAGRFRNLVLLVIDGCGLEVLRGAPASVLGRHVRGAMTSVFPSTTASAVTTLMTGLAPAEHGLTGWHMYFEEIDRVLAALPLTPREAASPACAPGSLPALLFSHEPIFTRLERECLALSPASIVHSDFNAYHTRGARREGYTDAGQMFESLRGALAHDAQPKFAYAYFPDLDALAHRHGIRSPEAAACLRAFDAALEAFLGAIQGSDTLVIATADHGFIDPPASRCIDLADHPRLADMLARPLCGERRVAYCYVKTGRRSDFEAYVQRHFRRAAHLRASADLARLGWFGPGAQHPRLHGRIGDYTLVMREDWTLTDWLPGEKRHRMLGVHAGVSAAEMWVPLIWIEA